MKWGTGKIPLNAIITRLASGKEGRKRDGGLGRGRGRSGRRQSRRSGVSLLFIFYLLSRCGAPKEERNEEERRGRGLSMWGREEGKEERERK